MWRTAASARGSAQEGTPSAPNSSAKAVLGLRPAKTKHKHPSTKHHQPQQRAPHPAPSRTSTTGDHRHSPGTVYPPPLKQNGICEHPVQVLTHHPRDTAPQSRDLPGLHFTNSFPLSAVTKAESGRSKHMGVWGGGAHPLVRTARFKMF